MSRLNPTVGIQTEQFKSWPCWFSKLHWLYAWAFLLGLDVHLASTPSLEEKYRLARVLKSSWLMLTSNTLIAQSDRWSFPSITYTERGWVKTSVPWGLCTPRSNSDITTKASSDIMDWWFKMQTFVHNGCEKLSEGRMGKQNNFIRVPRGIFFGAMPLVYLNCFSWRRAIYSSFHQLVATSLHHKQWIHHKLTPTLEFK